MREVKTMLCSLVLLICLSCSAAFAASPILLETTRSGSRYYMIGYEQNEGCISVLMRCIFSQADRDKTVALLTSQGVAKADTLACNDFKLRYSEDGSRYQRIYDVFLNDKGDMLSSVAQNSEAWYDTPPQADHLPAKALLEAARLLNVSVSLPHSSDAPAPVGNVASAQSRMPQRAMPAAAMIAAFRADEKTFAENYENAIVRVSGMRGKLSRDYDMLSMLLLPRSGGKGILCLFREDSMAALSTVKVGAEVVVEGVYKPGMESESQAVFVLDSCELIKMTEKKKKR